MHSIPRAIGLFVSLIPLCAGVRVGWGAPKDAAANVGAGGGVLKVGDWVGTGDGKVAGDGAGFVSEGRRHLVVRNPQLAGRHYMLRADLTFSTPGASFQLHFAEPPVQGGGRAKAAPAGRKYLTPEEVNPDASLAPMTRIALGKDGKTLQVGRQPFALADPAKPSVPLLVVVTQTSVDVYVGPEHESRDRRAGQAADLHFALAGGAGLQNLKVTPLPDGAMIPLVEASRVANTSVTSAAASPVKLDPGGVPRGITTINGVPFYFSETDKNAMDVATSMSGLKDPVRNKVFYAEKSTRSDGRIVLSVPGDQYAALHLIAFCAGRADHARQTTVRIGRYGDRSGIMEDIVVKVPGIGERGPDGAGPVAVKMANGQQGFLHHVRVPLASTANVKEFARFDLEFTREMNVHTCPPDPAEYGRMPVGLPSDVVILAATLEPSPVTMTYTAGELGNVFHDTQKVTFKLALANRSKEPQQVRAFATASGPGTGEEPGVTPATKSVEQKVTLAAGQSQEVMLDVTPGQRGWFSCAIGVEAEGKLVQKRDTTFAVLAPDTRKATTDSPFGVWEFWFPHSVARRANQVEILASLINKGGWRWTYGGHPAPRGQEGEEILKQMREKYKIMWTAHSLPEGYQRGAGWFDQAKFDATMPDAVKRALEVYDPYFKVLHESRSSTDLIRRFSEFFGGKPYDMPAGEKERLESQYENVKKYTLGIKKIDPRAKIVLINDYPAVASEYLSRGFPKEAFDAIGLEGAMFLRQPERQPDWMCLLGNLHQMKRSMAKYGYDKPIWTTEALYHPTEAGGLSLHEQGVIAVREAMIALELGVERMAAAGLIKDPSDDYHWSNWGSAGFCFRDPEINPKPSYAMYAWLTQVLDQAKPAGKLAVPNTSLHVVDFKKSDGSHVYGIWTVKGTQTVTFKSLGKAVVYDCFGNVLPSAGESLALTVSPTPQYVTGAVLEAVVSANPVEQKESIGKLLVDFDKPEAIRVAEAKNEVLENAWETLRIKGNFETSFVTEDGASAMKVTLKPDNDPRELLARYAEYQLTNPITLEGRPSEFACRIKGNSGWGRIMFEVVDAKGRVWTSCGNQYAGATNAADSRGQSFISFEGWHTIHFPIVGMYPGGDQSAFLAMNYNWWPTHAPESAELEAKNKEAKTAFDAEMKTYSAAEEAYKQAHAKWETDATVAKAAGKAAVAEPKKPVAPVFKPVRNMGLAPVDYPLKLTKILIDMRPSILYLDEERPVENNTIYVDALGVVGR